MEEKISFIPKKSLSSQPVSSGGGGGFVFFSFFIFVLSAALWGGLYMYRNYLKDNISQLSSSIEKQKASFELPTINEVIGFSEKIAVARNILDRHKAFSNILDFLGDFTMADVRFNDLNYSFGETGEPYVIVSGTARNYAVLASQIQVFEKYNYVKQVSVSGLASDANGMAKFNLKIILDPAILAYATK